MYVSAAIVKSQYTVNVLCAFYGLHANQSLKSLSKQCAKETFFICFRHNLPLFPTLPPLTSVPLFLPPSFPAAPSSTRLATPPSRCHWWIHPCRLLQAWLWTGSNTTCTGPTQGTNPSLCPQWMAPRGVSSSALT